MSWSIPTESNKVTAALPPRDRELLQEELDKGYDAWIWHYTGNCVSCSRCSHGPPTQEDLMPFFKSGEEGAASAWLEHMRENVW